MTRDEFIQQMIAELECQKVSYSSGPSQPSWTRQRKLSPADVFGKFCYDFPEIIDDDLERFSEAIASFGKVLVNESDGHYTLAKDTCLFLEKEFDINETFIQNLLHMHSLTLSSSSSAASNSSDGIMFGKEASDGIVLNTLDPKVTGTASERSNRVRVVQDICTAVFVELPVVMLDLDDAIVRRILRADGESSRPLKETWELTFERYFALIMKAESSMLSTDVRRAASAVDGLLKLIRTCSPTAAVTATRRKSTLLHRLQEALAREQSAERTDDTDDAIAVCDDDDLSSQSSSRTLLVKDLWLHVVFLVRNILTHRLDLVPTCFANFMSTLSNCIPVDNTMASSSPNMAIANFPVAAECLVVVCASSISVEVTRAVRAKHSTTSSSSSSSKTTPSTITVSLKALQHISETLRSQKSALLNRIVNICENMDAAQNYVSDSKVRRDDDLHADAAASPSSSAHSMSRMMSSSVHYLCSIGDALLLWKGDSKNKFAEPVTCAQSLMMETRFLDVFTSAFNRQLSSAFTCISSMNTEVSSKSLRHRAHLEESFR